MHAICTFKGLCSLKVWVAEALQMYVILHAQDICGASARVKRTTDNNRGGNYFGTYCVYVLFFSQEGYSVVCSLSF